MHEHRHSQRTGDGRVFLFLQGPHGPFFHRLACALRRTGALCWRVGFNTADAVFWPHWSSYVPFRAEREAWPRFLEELIARKGVTDIVLYADTRWMHEEACRQAVASGLNIHVFEEGYLRPYWVSYERNGANGRSALMSLDIKDMRRAVEAPDLGPPVPPGHWGDTRQHVFYGALYHWFVMFLNHRYPAFQSHRKTGLGAEFYFHFKRLVLLPSHAVERYWISRRVKARGAPFHLALLQLEHDASFQVYGPFERQEAFIDTVITAFAQGAPVHHHLVFKAHPLEDGRAGLPGMIRRAARRMGLANRVHFIRGGKLAWLLNDAEAVVTVNSTAGQQALWRGLPLRALGRAVYCKPELVSEQPLADFFAAPKPPDRTAYAVFREYLLRTSQIPGGFYARRGRDQIVRRVVDQMLEPPASEAASAAQRQHLRLVP